MQSPADTGISSSFPPCGVPAFRVIDERLGEVKELLDEQLTACNESVSRLLRRINIQSGKMIRPGLVLLAGSACGKVTDKHSRVATIVEMTHNATLLHDDVIDEGRKRRGLATINSLYGNESAVLLGDFLLGQVFKMCAALEPEITRVIAATAVRVCEGELRQVLQRRNWQLDESEYIDIITEKSAALFGSCCYLGGLLAKANEAQLKSLADFGLNTGIAFQITDDLLDIIGDESKTGKTLGSDVNKHKLTLAVIHLLRVVREKEKNSVVDELDAAGADKEVLVKMLRSYGSLEYAHGRAQEFVGKAIQALADLKESDAKNGLIGTAKFVADRVTIS